MNGIGTPLSGARLRVPWREALLVCATGIIAAGQTATPTFQHEILPLLTQRCVSCHGEKPAGGLDLRTLDSVMKGGATGKAIEPGKPDYSLLFKRVDSEQMPMAGKKFSREEKQLVRDWIERGQFPALQALANLPPEARINDEARKFWSYQKPIAVPAPAVKHREAVRTPIDAFILARLEAKNRTMNSGASREVLIRRAYLDIQGTPPTPEEVKAFVNDKSANAFAAVVDKLLTSPGYGERWARHWLDVAGYSDSNGYLGDEPRPYAWRYRDWVVKALNTDMPYDQFLLRQLAGDQLTPWRMGEKLSPETVDNLVATGFLRSTPDATDNQAIYEIDKQFDALHAVTEVSIKAVMGMNLNCARCHDHKFDPVLQKDYYRIMALFRPAYDPDDEFPKAKDKTKWLPGNIGWGAWPIRLVPNATAAEIASYIKANSDLEANRRKNGRQTAQVYAAARDRWREAQYSKLSEPVRGELLKALKTPAKDRNAVQGSLLKEYATKFQIEDEELGAIDQEVARLEAGQEVENEKLRKAKPEMLWATWDVSKNAETRLLARGNFDSPGEKIAPGVPLILDNPKAPFHIPEVPADSPHTGRRLAFARWLTQKDHPLTARVIVNRVWQYHFGTGIVNTPDDFGSQGARPSHPELLDWLAVNFVEHGWSLKWLHRQIMTSAVYQQSSTVPGEAFREDERNTLLGRWGVQRMDAEQVRDAVLKVTGQLSSVMFGPPIAMCTLPDGSYFTDPSGRTDDKVEGHTRWFPPPCEKAGTTTDPSRQPTRRSIYVETRRTYGMGFLGAFDAPVMETNASSRFSTASPRQALSMLHNPLVLQSAEKLAARAKADAGDDIVARIRRMMELTWSRPSSEAEVAFAFGEVKKQTDTETGLRLLGQALLGSNEFLYIY